MKQNFQRRKSIIKFFPSEPVREIKSNRMNAATLMKQYRQNELRRTLAVSYFCTFCLNNMRRYFSSYLCTQRIAMGKQNSRILFTGFPCLFAPVQVYVRIRKAYLHAPSVRWKGLRGRVRVRYFGSDTFTELCAVIKLVLLPFPCTLVPGKTGKFNQCSEYNFLNKQDRNVKYVSFVELRVNRILNWIR